MKLKEYLKKNKITIKSFSDLIGCHRVHLNGVMNGVRTPSRVLEISIYMATKGSVKPDWMPETDAKESALL